MTNDSIEATWIGFHLWCEAVEAAGTVELDKVRAALGGRQIAAPSGFMVKMDGKSHHLYKREGVVRYNTSEINMLYNAIRDGHRPVSVRAGIVRTQGVRSLWVVCELCHHEAVLNVDGYGDAEPVPALGPRMVCTSCGSSARMRDRIGRNGRRVRA
jgi:hypothetical protein